MIWISSHEASTPVSAKITVPKEGRIKCTYYERDQHSPQRKDANVLNDYYDEYRLAYEVVEKNINCPNARGHTAQKNLKASSNKREFACIPGRRVLILFFSFLKTPI